MNLATLPALCSKNRNAGLAALVSAVLSINYLRSYGVYVAWCADPTASEQ